MKIEEALGLVEEVKNCSLPWGDAHWEALGMVINYVKDKLHEDFQRIDPTNDLPKLSGHIDKNSVEYTRTDAFIEKAAEYLMDYEFNDSPTIADRRKRVEEFKKAMRL